MLPQRDVAAKRPLQATFQPRGGLGIARFDEVCIDFLPESKAKRAKRKEHQDDDDDDDSDVDMFDFGKSRTSSMSSTQARGEDHFRKLIRGMGDPPIGDAKEAEAEEEGMGVEEIELSKPLPTHKKVADELAINDEYYVEDQFCYMCEIGSYMAEEAEKKLLREDKRKGMSLYHRSLQQCMDDASENISKIRMFVNENSTLMGMKQLIDSVDNYYKKFIEPLCGKKWSWESIKNHFINHEEVENLQKKERSAQLKAIRDRFLSSALPEMATAPIPPHKVKLICQVISMTSECGVSGALSGPGKKKKHGGK